MAQSIGTLRKHFEAKGFDVWTIADRHLRIHTLDLFQNKKIVMSFRVVKDMIRDDHLREQVSRYAQGLPIIHPWTGKVEK